MSIHKAFEEAVAPNKVHETLSKHMLTDGFDFVLDLDKSEGAYLYDARDGRRYLDLFTFFASNPIGMNHPKLNNEEFIKKIGRVALSKPSNSDIYTVEMAEFVQTFFEVAVPDHFKYAFFIAGGALAVENALKTAIDWKVRKNIKAGKPETLGTKVLHFKQAFHGRTGYTMSLTNTDPTKVRYWPKFTDWPRVTNPFAEFPLEGENLTRTIERERSAIAEIEAAFAEYKDDIACIILEPIQGEGGDNHFRPEFFRELRRICDEQEAMLIFDEVQTGLGLTGEMWAHQSLGVNPDIMAFGKKMQVCGIVVNNRVDEIDENVFHTSSRINSTWGGNLVDMVRVTKYLEIIDEENLLENARTVGAYLLEQIHQLMIDYPEIVSNPRGRGLMCAMTIRDSETRNYIVEGALARGVMILGCGERSIRFRPPLNLTRKQVDEGVGALRDVLKSI
ncbi:MAG: L-lysine 6-transaminase [Ignavibacteriae bacterium]|nr:L-lysine 6-transaminase [Ignavibacteriota bacterium]MCB9216961.1 L-lysine 6-transaminase [Ignavibacteria bacterium]